MINQLVYRKSSKNFNCAYIISIKFHIIMYNRDIFALEFYFHITSKLLGYYKISTKKFIKFLLKYFVILK